MPIQIQNALRTASAPSASTVTPRADAPPAREGPPAAPPVEAVPAMDRERLKRAVESINRRLAGSANSVRLSLGGDAGSLDDNTGELVVTVVDAATEQVIRQIPSEEVLAISRSVEKLQGLLLNQQA